MRYINFFLEAPNGGFGRYVEKVYVLSVPYKPRKSLKKSPGASGPGSRRESGKGLEEVSFWDLLESFSRVSRLFRDSRGASGPEAPGDFFGV